MRDPWPLPTAPSRQGTVAGSTDSRGNRSEGHPSAIGQAAATPVRWSETQVARPNGQPPTNSRVKQDSDKESPTNGPDANRARTSHVEDKSSNDLNVAHMQSVDIERRHRDDNHHGPEDSSTSSKSVSRPSERPRTNNSQSAHIQPQPPATQDEDSDGLEGFKIVHRKPKTASLFVCGIKIKNSADDTRNTLLNYLRKRMIKVAQLRIVKRGKFYMSVKLNVDPSHKDTVLSDNFWQGGVQCRQWHFDNGEANLS